MKGRVLITGGAGFIGSHTADLLLKKGYKVRVLDNLSQKTHYGIWPGYLDKKTQKIKGDVRNKKDWLQALKHIDYVIHLAGWMDLVPEISKFFEINVVGTTNLYETIVKYNLPIKKVVIASSQFVYGEGKWKCNKDGVVFPKGRKERDLKNGIWDPKCPICGDVVKSLKNDETYQDPPNSYAISKYAQEFIAIQLGKSHSIPTTALRYSIVHGSRQTLKNLYSGALRNFTLQILNGLEPSIYEDGNQKRDYVSVLDVARANYIALHSSKVNYEVFNVGGGKAYSVKQLTKLIADSLGQKTPHNLTGMYRVGDIRHAVSDISKLKKHGWSPKHTEKENIEEFIKWVRSHKNASGKGSSTSTTINKMTRKGMLKTIN